MAYQGSTEIASGLIPRRASAGNDFPLMSAHHVQVGNDDTDRLDDALDSINEALDSIEDAIDSLDPGGSELPTVSASNNGAVLQVSNGAWSIGLKIVVITESDDEALQTHDQNTIYIIVRDPS